MSRSIRDMVIDTTLTLIDANGKTDLTAPEIRNHVETAIQVLNAHGLDADEITKEVETLRSTTISEFTAMYSEDHVEWLKDRQAQTGQDWPRWKRYEKYLMTSKRWAPKTLKSLDDVTDEILGATEDPERKGSWDNRGMVVGQVQSGKTANYTGLICKALDAGYKIVIILTGVHNSLRSQTQIRIDEGLLGIDTNKTRNISNDSKYIGVGTIPSKLQIAAVSLTTSANNGDFVTATAESSSNQFGSDPFILTVKKNKTILNAIYRWALSTPTHEDGSKLIDNIPLLLIDDEADFASVNTKDSTEADEVSAINGKIRDILNLFKKSSYVAYTATPFANIFIDANTENAKYGKDLFPRNFIISLPAPSDYVGPETVFGTDETKSLENAFVRVVDDAAVFYPPKHKKDHEPGGLPDSLKDAILSFVLTCRLRELKGQTHVHNSMLVHVSRYVAVQNLVGEDIAAYLDKARKELEYNQSHGLTDRMKWLWEEDFKKYLDDFAQSMNDIESRKKIESWKNTSWTQIHKGLLESIKKITVNRMNGSAKDALSYIDNEEKGLSVIAIGGDKLSRGLTLEGLSLSYFLRTSKTYDTLMQMGRWFGYRPGYLQLCRLYTSADLVDHYRHIAVASEALTQQFNDMAQTGATPKQYGLRVMSHPEGLLLATAKNKMRSGQEIKISYGMDLIETKHFDRSLKAMKHNLENANRFISELDKVHGSSSGTPLVWSGVTPEEIMSFLEFYRAENPYATSAGGALLADYIRKQEKHGELVDWTVVLMSAQGSDRTETIAGHKVGTYFRKAASRHSSTVYSLNKSRLGSAKDESLDLTQSQKDHAKALMQAKAREKHPDIEPPSAVNNGEWFRQQRDSSRGLLLIYPLGEKLEDGTQVPAELPYVGYSVSFPESQTAEKVSYIVNASTYYDQEDDDNVDED